MSPRFHLSPAALCLALTALPVLAEDSKPADQPKPATQTQPAPRSTQVQTQAATKDGKLFVEQTVTGPDGKTVTLTTDANKTVTKNPDGSVTIDTTKTTTNLSTGQSRTADTTTQVKKTDAGSTFTRETQASNTRGGSAQVSTTGEVTRNGDGSGSASATTEATKTLPNGETKSLTTQRDANWSPNDQGGKDFNTHKTTTTQGGATSTVDRTGSTFRIDDTTKGFEVTGQRSNSNGGSASTHTQGQVTKTDSGREWNATTQGSNNRGAEWTTQRDGSVTRNGDGTATVDATATRTGKDGQTVTVQKDGVITKTDSGFSYEGQRDVTRTPGNPTKPSETTKPVTSATLNKDAATTSTGRKPTIDDKLPTGRNSSDKPRVSSESLRERIANRPNEGEGIADRIGDRTGAPDRKGIADRDAAGRKAGAGKLRNRR